MRTHYARGPVLDINPQPVQSRQYPVYRPCHHHTFLWLPAKPHPRPTNTLFCNKGERGVFLNPESFHRVDFTKGLTSSPSTGECRKWPLDLRRFWAPDSQISDQASCFLNENMRGLGKSKEVRNKQRVGGPGKEKALRMEVGRVSWQPTARPTKPDSVRQRAPSADGIFLS